MNSNSGIWVYADKAKKAAEETIIQIRRERREEYRESIRHYQWVSGWDFFLWVFSLGGDETRFRKKPLPVKKAIKLANEHNARFRAEIHCGLSEEVCEDVIRACKVPPADNKIFLTLETVNRIGL